MIEFRITKDQPCGTLVMGCKQYDLVVQGKSYSDLLKKMGNQFDYYQSNNSLSEVPAMPDGAWATFNTTVKED